MKSRQALQHPLSRSANRAASGLLSALHGELTKVLGLVIISVLLLAGASGVT